MLSQKAYTLKIPLEGCETKRNDEGNFENAIIVQDHVSYLQSSDKKYLLTCIPSNPEQRHDSMITVDFGGVTVDNRHTTTEVISGTLPPNALMPAANLKYQVEIRAGHGIDALPLSAPLNIGDPISYIVKLEKPRLRRHFDHPVSDLAEIRTISTKLRIRRAESALPTSSTNVITADSDDSAINLSLIHFGLIGGCILALLVLFSLIGFLFQPSKMPKLWQSS
uniref:ZP domain-containing protein n=1 Tax=Panagrolaimus sp. JU765 TaxID=591449 RepID=A0AC34QLC9_9BILA